ncbi:MAG: carbon-nitrogen hydrolase family protein [Thermoleophilaceae bacterium]
MRASAVQLNSNEDKQRNLAQAEELTRAAAADGAELIVLPEKFNVLGTHEHYLDGAETLDGPTVGWARDIAAELRIDLVAGSIVERREGREKLSNTCVHVGPEGDIRGVYRKIHMFDVVVGGVEYRESESEEPGGDVVVSELADGEPVGLTVCYDLRFPELFRILAIRGATVITLPAAFTKVTGQAHWEILVRARAIENQVFMVAAGQVGVHPEGKESFGRSMIVDPWGEVLAVVEDDAPGFCTADLDFHRQAEVREQLPSLANRVASAYAWPEEAKV